MIPSELKNTLVKTVRANLPVLIKGAPGVGKSDIVTQVAKRTKRELIISHPVVDDPTDYKGLPANVNGKAEFLPFGNLRAMLEATKPTIAFLDDLGQAPAVVQAAAMQLLLARQINGHKISDKIVFIAATNRRQDKAGVTSILEPVKSRFATILELEPDLDDWLMWAINNDMPEQLIGFIHFRPDLLHQPSPTNEIVNHPCPRTIAFAGKLINAGLIDFEVLKGAMGEGPAAELIGFLKICDELPNIDAIISSPKTAKVPTDPSALYAVTSALAKKLRPQNAARILCYGKQMPKDFETLLVRDGIRHTPSVQQTKAFINWSVRNRDILV